MPDMLKKIRFQKFIKMSTTNNYILMHLFIIHTYNQRHKQRTDLKPP